MGLTVKSTGRGLDSGELRIQRSRPEDRIIALAGNPNVGKSTIFNSLTGMKQHTGNWPGKTVSNAWGLCKGRERSYLLVDLPGSYSLMADSPEEELARDFICFGGADAVLVVCDAGCLERNMNLLLQTIETGRRVLLCVNLMDEAERRGIRIHTDKLAERLGIPVTGTVARDRKSRDKLLGLLDGAFQETDRAPYIPVYPQQVERALETLLPLAGETEGLSPRFICIGLLLGLKGMEEHAEKELLWAAREQRELLEKEGLGHDRLHDAVVSTLVKAGEDICRETVEKGQGGYSPRDRAIDRIVTSRVLGYPLMLLLLAAIFYLTIKGANYPSQWLSAGLFYIYEKLLELFAGLNAPVWLTGLLVEGAYKTLAWVVSVMLPPMAIFFPLFTLLEDSGYLPRIAYNLDRPFCRCSSCGRQALTMAMGFGCNAAGVVGCRIINSPRERLLAIITNSLVPCNGRFPTLIALISMFLIGAGGGAFLSALALTGFILLSVLLSFLCTKLLGTTLLRGESSAFVLELPPYRRPELGKVIVRSIFDRTLFVLGRAAAVAAPAGAALWLLANIPVGTGNVLTVMAGFLEPLGRLMGMDGVILLAFILGFPANEIVLPVAVMIYSTQGSLTQLGELTALAPLLSVQGWTALTAVCVMLFSLCHWPCSTTLLTIWKETGSLKWTAISALLPTTLGFVLCTAVTAVGRLITA